MQRIVILLILLLNSVVGFCGVRELRGDFTISKSCWAECDAIVADSSNVNLLAKGVNMIITQRDLGAAGKEVEFYLEYNGKKFCDNQWVGEDIVVTISDEKDGTYTYTILDDNNIYVICLPNTDNEYLCNMYTDN